MNKLIFHRKKEVQHEFEYGILDIGYGMIVINNKYCACVCVLQSQIILIIICVWLDKCSSCMSSNFLPSDVNKDGWKIFSTDKVKSCFRGKKVRLLASKLTESNENIAQNYILVWSYRWWVIWLKRPSEFWICLFIQVQLTLYYSMPSGPGLLDRKFKLIVSIFKNWKKSKNSK